MIIIVIPGIFLKLCLNFDMDEYISTINNKTKLPILKTTIFNASFLGPIYTN